MKDEEIEKAFEKAQDRWLIAHPGVGYSSIQHRYFFFAGSEFGLASAKTIYGESLGNAAVDSNAVESQ